MSLIFVISTFRNVGICFEFSKALRRIFLIVLCGILLLLLSLTPGNYFKLVHRIHDVTSVADETASILEMSFSVKGEAWVGQLAK